MGRSAERLAVFRTDASVEMGTGHAVRCLALADALSESGWSCTFACRPGTLEAVPALASAAHSVIELDGAEAVEPRNLTRHWPQCADLLIVDHYMREAVFERACRAWARRILVVDDLADRSHDCDILLDPTLGRADADYRELVPGECRLLLGPHYALLRPQFAAARAKALARRAAASAVHRILVSFGGTDPTNATSLALRAIARSGLDVEVDVVLGRAAAHASAVRKLAAEMPQRMNVLCDVTDMASLMVAADLAVGGAGSTIWERMCLGLPSISVVLAPNQEFAARIVAAHKVSRNLKSPLQTTTLEDLVCALSALAGSVSCRQEMSEAGFSLVDGEGARRVSLILSGTADRSGGDDGLTG